MLTFLQLPRNQMLFFIKLFSFSQLFPFFQKATKLMRMKIFTLITGDNITRINLILKTFRVEL